MAEITSLRARSIGVALACAGVLAAAFVASPSDARSAAPTDVEPASLAEVAPGRPAVLSTRVIGTSVRGRPIRAYELGDRRAARTVVAVGSIHGNEKAGGYVLGELVQGAPIRGVHLWVVPRLNPDGVLRNTRQNARGVDLNRNFPVRWARLTGRYYSGPRPASEPETRALMRFLNRVNPDFVTSFHQPLYGVDMYESKNPAFARRLATHLRLPLRRFDCGGVCHGTMLLWFDARHRGALVTIEFGRLPSRRYVQVVAPRGLLLAVGGTR